MPEVESTTKKAKKALVDTVTEEVELETPKKAKKSLAEVEETAEEKEARKAEKRKKKQEQADAEAAEAEAMPEAAAEDDEERRKRKEEKKKRKAAEAAAMEGEAEAMPEAAAEEDDEERRKRKEEKKKRKQAEAAAAGEHPAQDEAPKKKAKIEAEKEIVHQVFVGGLPFTADESKLRGHFAVCGEIASFLMPLNGKGKPRGIAFITYKTEEGLEKALRRDGAEYQGRTLKVNRSEVAKADKVAEKPEEAKAQAEEKTPKVEETAKVDARPKRSQDEAPKKKAKTEPATADAEKAEADAKAPEKGSKLTVFVGGLATTCTEEALRKQFSKCGEIKEVKIPGKKKGRGVAFITYTSDEDVQKALKLNASDYKGRTLRVTLLGEGVKKEVKEKAPVHQVFVGGLPFTADEAKLKEHFGACGEIEAFLLPLNTKGKPRGIAFITYKTEEGLEKALRRDGAEYEGRTLKVNRSEVEKADKATETPEEAKAKAEEKSKKAEEKAKVDAKAKAKREKKAKGEGKGEGEGQGSSALQVFVGGLPFEADEETVRKTFAECGEIVSFKKVVPSKPEKKPRGIVFITYKTQAGFDKALAFDGTDYEGKTLKVNEAGDGGKGKGKDGGKGEGKGKDAKGKGKDGKSKGKDGKHKGGGKDSKGEGKGGKGKGKDGKGKGKGKGKKGSKAEDEAAAKALFDDCEEL